MVFIFDRQAQQGQSVQGSPPLADVSSDALKLLTPEASQSCSFCGRSGSQVARLFPAEVGVAEGSSVSPRAFICNHCVQRFHSMLGTAET
jgi:hypothetical protein